MKAADKLRKSAQAKKELVSNLQNNLSEYKKLLVNDLLGTINIGHIDDNLLVDIFSKEDNDLIISTSQNSKIFNININFDLNSKNNPTIKTPKTIFIEHDSFKASSETGTFSHLVFLGTLAHKLNTSSLVKSKLFQVYRKLIGKNQEIATLIIDACNLEKEADALEDKLSMDLFMLFISTNSRVKLEANNNESDYTYIIIDVITPKNIIAICHTREDNTTVRKYFSRIDFWDMIKAEYVYEHLIEEEDGKEEEC